MTAAPADPNLDERVLLLTPTGRDGALATETLRRSGIAAREMRSATALALAMEEGAGAVLVAEEALSPFAVRTLSQTLSRQSPWSDLPFLVFAAPMDTGAASLRVEKLSSSLGNVTLLERPVRVATLVAAVRAALRARHRQYAARETLDALEIREAELKLADHRKDDFLAMLAHELRNPMAALSLALELIANARGDATRVERHRTTAHRQLEHLVRLVDDLLDVSRITRGTFELRKASVDLCTVVDCAVAAQGPVIEAQGIELRIERSEVALPLHADATRLEQVVSNLLSNAAKFTDPGGRIDLRVSASDREALLVVRDTGRGIPAPMMDRVFEPFVQVDPGVDRTKGGLGLGLTLVRRLVQMHGGRVTASSDGPGAGSTFEIRLPLRAFAPVVASTREYVSLVTPRRRILVVEDSPDVRDTLAEYLESLGHTVELASSGPEGEQKLLSLLPDVALIDVGLPEMDGYEIARRVRAHPKGQQLLLVALTGYGGPEAEAAARSAGFDLYLVKPLDTARLPEVLNHPRFSRQEVRLGA